MQFSSFHFDSIFSESRTSLKPMMILNKMNIETACIRLLEIFRNLDTFVIPNIFGNFDLFRESQKFRDSVPISGKSSFPTRHFRDLAHHCCLCILSLHSLPFFILSISRNFLLVRYLWVFLRLLQSSLSLYPLFFSIFSSFFYFTLTFFF